MKYRFSDEALLTMSIDVGHEKETDFTRQLYNKLHKAWWYSSPLDLPGLVFPRLRKVDLSSEEVDYLSKICEKGNGTLLGRGKEAGIELSRLVNR